MVLCDAHVKLSHYRKCNYYGYSFVQNLFSHETSNSQYKIYIEALLDLASYRENITLI